MTVRSLVFTNPSTLWVSDELHWGVLMLDVRDAEEHDQVHIPGSRHAPLERLLHRSLGIRDRAAGRRVILVSEDGQRAEQGCRVLLDAGLTSVEVLAGGLSSWQAAGLPLIRRSDPSVRLQARVLMGSLAVGSLVYGILVSPVWLTLASPCIVSLLAEGVRDVSLLAPLVEWLPWNRRRRRALAAAPTEIAESVGPAREPDAHRLSA